MKNDRPLPQWLAAQQYYQPAADKDAFIDKSILSVLSVLARIRSQGAPRAQKLRAGAELSLAFTLLLVVLLSLTHSTAFVLVVLVGLLCRLCLMPAAEIARVLKGGLAAALFTALVLLPAAVLGNWYSIGMITPKVFVSVSAVAMLTVGARWHELTGALKFFFVPDLFIFVLDIALRYILLLGEFALNMLYALKVRSVGRNADKRASLSGIAGTLFLRSREMAEELHGAMVCRGFTGSYRRPSRLTFGVMDGLTALSAAGLLYLFLTLK